MGQPIERKGLIAMYIFLSTSFLLLGNSAMSQEDCNVFQEGACSLDESNIIGTANDVANAAECQAVCKFEPSGSCNFFTFLDTGCYLLSSCDFVGTCPTCICGPTSPPFSECPWPPLPDTTMMPSTTLGSTTGTTTMPPSPTTTMPATLPTRPPSTTTTM